MPARFLTLLLAPDTGTGSAVQTLDRPPAKGDAKGEPVRVPFATDVPFTKQVAADPKTGDIMLTGYANTWIEDRDMEIIVPGAFDSSLQAYVDKNPIVLWQHNPDWPIGQVLEAKQDDTGLWVRAVIRRELCINSELPELKAAYFGVKTGTVRTFSIGGWFVREVKDGQLLVTDVELWELSVVSVPANTDSIFEAVVKAARGEKTGRLADTVTKQMSQLLGAEPMSDPQLVAMTEEQRGHHYADLARIYRRAGVQPPGRDSWRLVEQTVKGVDEKQAHAVLATFIAQLKGAIPVDGVKAGRVLSSSNESKLRAAHGKMGEARDTIDEVLSAVTEDEAAAPGTAPTCPKCGANVSPEMASCVACGHMLPGKAAEPAGGVLTRLSRATDKVRTLGKTLPTKAPDDSSAQVEALGNIVEAIEGVLEGLGWSDPDEPDAGEGAEAPETPAPEDYADAVEQLGNLVEAAEAVLETMGWADPDA